MEIIDMYYAALFIKAPKIGTVNPDGEFFYTNYKRIVFLVINGKNIDDIEFPICDQNITETVLYLVVLNSVGTVINVKVCHEIH